MLYHNDFRDTVLLEPLKNGADSLKIVSGYATHTMASWHITEIASRGFMPIGITLIVGMCPFDGLSIDVHDGFQNIVERNGTDNLSELTCQYVIEGAPVHSKLYIWEQAGTPISSFLGSANYTQSAFSAARRELLQRCDPVEALEYFQFIEANSMYCTHAEVEDHVNFKQNHPVLDAEEGPVVSLQGAGVQSVTLSLLTRKNDVGFGSGINWGHRKNGLKREPNQMYIPLPIHIAHSGFFPLGKNHFSVLTDDSKQLILRVEQQNDKAITTPLNNSLLGEYFRNRLGVANGAFVTKQDLINYGRTDVTFYRLDEEQFFMDFSA